MHVRHLLMERLRFAASRAEFVLRSSEAAALAYKACSAPSRSCLDVLNRGKIYQGMMRCEDSGSPSRACPRLNRGSALTEKEGVRRPWDRPYVPNCYKSLAAAGATV